MASTRTRRPVSRTIESGFAANRRARGAHLEDTCRRLADIAREHPGVEVRWPSFNAEHRNLTEVKLLGRNQVLRNAKQIGWLSRASVYAAIEQIPGFQDTFRATAESVNHEEDAKTRPRFVAVRLDAGSSQRLSDDRNRIWTTLSELNEMPLDTLEIPLDTIDLPLAWVPEHISPGVYEAMQEVVQERLVSRAFQIKPGRLFPRFDSQPSP